LGALALLAAGAVHLQQYLGAGYHSIPTIGTLFVLNAAGSAIVGIGLLAPIERALTPRRAELWIGGLALTAVAIAVASLIALFVSESGSLFGFSETGYRAAIVVAIVAEAATILLLVPVAAVSLGRAFAHRAGGQRSRRGHERGARGGQVSGGVSGAKR
jgi:hypothetical protein